MTRLKRLTVVGGGLAGCEAAWQAARRGITVDLYEMRPKLMTPAHTGGDLAELVCSNSLGSRLADRPTGLLMAELRLLDSLLLDCAEQVALPAGGALAVDRRGFSAAVAARIEGQSNITIHRAEAETLPAGPAVIASGPLTSPRLAEELVKLAGVDSLFFYDAIAPIVTAGSIDMKVAFRASRFDKEDSGAGDYINCPFTREEYERFVNALVQAERIPLRTNEGAIDRGVSAGSGRFFEGCLPVEVLATRGIDSLAYGPMRPIGLHDPRTGNRPHAVLQLRQEDLAGSLYNLVGFQTNLTYPEQERIFRLVPGLEQAEFVRFGQMHRNTFIAAPVLLDENLCYRDRLGLLFAGQLVGVEGYLGSVATGLLAGINAARLSSGKAAIHPPRTTMLGALVHYVTHADLNHFQPMKSNFGLLPDLEGNCDRLGKREKHVRLAGRAITHLKEWIQENRP